MADNVNHPAHYETGKFECIDVMVETQGVEATQNFCVCNALKYVYRHKKKNGMEDLQKAIWYLNKAVELEEAKNAKLAMEYLKSLGFDLSDLVKADENPVTTALSVEVDTRFLFIGGKKNEVE